MGFWAIAAPLLGAAVDAFTGRASQNRAPGLAGQTAYNENYRGMAGRLEAAKAYGIHPALALGSSISSSGAPGMVGTDFRGAFAEAANTATRQREWKQEVEMRREEEKSKQNQRNLERQRAMQEERLTNAQISHIEKQNSLIDEQIRASAEQRVREANRTMVSSASGPHDSQMGVRGRKGRVLVDNVSNEVVYVPNEVTRHRSGQAQGENPGYEWVNINGRRVKVPFGTTQNHEPSELYQMYRDIEAALGPDGLIGQKWRDFWNGKADTATGLPILPSDYSDTPRRRFRGGHAK